jgi:hypothetical protein
LPDIPPPPAPTVGEKLEKLSTYPELKDLTGPVRDDPKTVKVPAAIAGHSADEPPSGAPVPQVRDTNNPSKQPGPSGIGISVTGKLPGN